MNMKTATRLADYVSANENLTVSVETIGAGVSSTAGVTVSRRNSEGVHDFLGVFLVPTSSLPELLDEPKQDIPVKVLGPKLASRFDYLLESQGSIKTSDIAAMLTSEAFRRFCTSHLLTAWWIETSGRVEKDPAQIVERTALLFRDLTLWGEVAPAPVLAEWFDAPVGTIHNRLRLARERGLLAEAPGRGRRRRGVAA